MQTIKCITMQKDEALLLDPWLRYHGFLFGFENLVVVDNGSVLPEVLSVLETYEAAGVTVYRQFTTGEHYHRKGPITADVIRILDHQTQYDFAIPLDCDEFLGLWQLGNVTCDRSTILAYLASLPAHETHFRIDTCLYNDPARPRWFWPQFGLKGLMRSGSVQILDHGCHTFSDQPDFRMARCELTHFHLHHKPFEVVQEHARWKLAGFVDLNDQAALRNFKGPGEHLIRNLLSTPEEYYRQLQDHVTIQVPGFSIHMRALGVESAMITEPHTPALPAGKVLIRLPRDFSRNCPDDVGETLAFDPIAYRRANFDLAAAGVNPLRHFLYSGYREQRPLA